MTASRRAPAFVHSTSSVDEVSLALKAAGFAVEAHGRVRRTLLDTFDGRLHGAGLRLELREGGTKELILTGPRTAPARVTVRAAPRLARDLPAGPLQARVAGLIDIRALVAKVTFTGPWAVATLVDSAGKTLVTLIVQGRQRTARSKVSEPGVLVEVVEHEGYPKAADRARRVLRTLGLDPRDLPAFDLIAAESGVDLEGFDGSPAVALHASEPAIEGFRRVLAKLSDAIDANWPGVIDDVDPEFLHDLRVATRRTRSVLAQAGGVLPPGIRSRFREEFGWLGTATSPTRDLDVYLIEWAGYVHPLGAATAALVEPVRAHIAARRQNEQARLVEALRSDRYQRLSADWRRWLTADPTQGGSTAEAAPAPRPLGKVVVRRVEGAQRRLLDRGRLINSESPAVLLHDLRKDAKRLRYLLECFGGLFDAAATKQYVARLKALQDNLGEHQDAEVHAYELGAIAGELHGQATPETLMAVGQLTGQFEHRRRATRAEFAERFAAYDTARTQRQLDAVLRSVGGA